MSKPKDQGNYVAKQKQAIKNLSEENLMSHDMSKKKERNQQRERASILISSQQVKKKKRKEDE